MEIKPISNNLIELNQNNKTYEIMIVDGLIRIKIIDFHPNKDKIIFEEK